MVEKVEGYLTNDGSFYENELDAIIHERTQKLKLDLQSTGYKAESVFKILNDHFDSIFAFMGACRRKKHNYEHQAVSVSVPISDELAEKLEKELPRGKYPVTLSDETKETAGVDVGESMDADLVWPLGTKQPQSANKYHESDYFDD